MCLLVIGFRTVPMFPLVLAANRDELLDRPSEAPGLLRMKPAVVGGRDLLAGGTWLGVNEHGLTVAITNRYDGPPPEEGRPSRGVLCLEALACTNAQSAVEQVAAKARAAQFNPFNLLATDKDSLWMVSNVHDDAPWRLQDGWHIVGNGALNDMRDARVARARSIIAVAAKRRSGDPVGWLEGLCRDHGVKVHDGMPPVGALCLHRQHAGTRSSSILVRNTRGILQFRHADGPPCNTPYRQIRLPWA